MRGLSQRGNEGIEDYGNEGLSTVRARKGDCGTEGNEMRGIEDCETEGGNEGTED